MNGESLEIQVSDKLDESMFIIICNQLRCKCWMFHDVNYWQKIHPNILIGILGYHQVRIHLRLLRVEFRWLGMLIRKKCGQNKASASAHSLQNKSTWACYLDMLPKYYCYPFCFTAAKIWNKNPIRVFLVWGKMFNGSHLAKTFYNFYTGANLRTFSAVSGPSGLMRITRFASNSGFWQTPQARRRLAAILKKDTKSKHFLNPEETVWLKNVFGFQERIWLSLSCCFSE